MTTDCPTNEILCGDAFDVLEELPEESVHAIVTDPPYGLAFMGRDWDDFEPKEYQEWCEKWAQRCLDVLKPGGHLLAFSGNRTHHRLFSGVQDAGFEIRDTLTWHYGSGFPKALDVPKAIDDKMGEEGDYGAPKGERAARAIENGADDHRRHDGYQRPWMDDEDAIERNARKYIPATDAAERFDGFRTSLKPATEFVVCARKPLADGTVAENVLEYGTGALNIDDCRVEYESEADLAETEARNPGRETTVTSDVYGENRPQNQEVNESGRYPSNLILDKTEAERLDREIGDVDGCQPKTLEDAGERDLFPTSTLDGGKRTTGYDDSGGPSRYFYTSKASKAERTLDGKIDNAHPTVKPQDLMEWLVQLVTAQGQLVLDPFAGSGTTCKAAKELGREFIGIEKQQQWADVARVRCNLTPDDPSHVRDDDAQQGLEVFADGGTTR